MHWIIYIIQYAGSYMFRQQSAIVRELLKSVCYRSLHFTFNYLGGGAVVEALRYKLEGRGIDSRWCHLNFSLTYSFRSHYDPGVDSSSNRNEYQEYFLGVKAAGA
jgi:hypothetical protein